MSPSDAIVAVSSGAGGGGMRAIVRMSGAGVRQLAQAVTDWHSLESRGWFDAVSLLCLGGHNRLAAAMVFEGPRSFTGEDVVELHMPDSGALARAVIAGILKAGRQSGIAVRMAEAGEFSARAFLNGKIDLTEAEGIAATINASNAVELRAAASLRDGHLHREIERMTATIAELLALVEAGIDFSDEADVAFVSREKALETLDEMAKHVERVIRKSVRVDRLSAPPTVALTGRPNVGKSSLMNALVNSDRSIVSAAAGTTRDMVGALMRTEAAEGRGGLEVRLLDVPGDEEPSDDMRVKMMEARARALAEADLVVEVLDERGGRTDAPGGTPRMVVRNKADLMDTDTPEEADKEIFWGRVSAKTGFGVAQLREAIGQRVQRAAMLGDSEFALNQRHREILVQLQACLTEAAAMARDREVFVRHPELLAAELRRGLDLLGRITGAVSPDEVLGRIFSTFCIGK